MAALKGTMVTFNRPDDCELQDYLATPANSGNAPA